MGMGEGDMTIHRSGRKGVPGKTTKESTFDAFVTQIPVFPEITWTNRRFARRGRRYINYNNSINVY